MTPALGFFRAAFESSGSPSWVMHVIRSRALDHRHDFHLDLVLGGDRGDRLVQATQTVLAEGRADMIDTDWISIGRSRLCGPALIAVFPYGKIMGGMVASSASGMTGSLAQLRGRRVGVIRIADKNWTVARAVCRKRHGFDPQMEAQVAEAMSKTTLVGWLETGEVEVAVLPWHLVPRMTAHGRFRQLCDVLDLLPDLDAPSIPTTFFAVRPEFAATRQDLIAAFVAAYRDAVSLMLTDENVWREAAAQPGDDPAMLDLLRAAWLRRICSAWPEDAARQLEILFERLKSVGGEDSLGVATASRDIFVPALSKKGRLTGEERTWLR
jgi:NitT/TauT family transport system substrate-binding protein